MNLQSLREFLAGRPHAIEQVASCRSALWLGLAFVISAGLAREYDGEDLLAEPWHLLIPLGASIVSSLLLFAVLRLVLRREGTSPDYRTFLACFWMTAPLAWLYAIPIERFLSPVGAVRFNLMLLALVALWRVLLITRVSGVLFRVSFLKSLFPVMLFSDVLVLIILYLTPLPVFSIMGGIRLSESEAAIQGTSLITGLIGVASLPIWLCGTIRSAIAKRQTVPVEVDSQSRVPQRRVSGALWLTAAGLVLLGAALLPITQPEQQNRSKAERLLESGHVAEAVAFMSSRERAEFPPHWDPPPRFGYGQTQPRAWKVIESIQQSNTTATWVRDLFVQKLIDRERITLGELSDDELSRYVETIRQLKEAPTLARHHRYQIEREFSTYDPVKGETIDANPSESRRAALQVLQQMDVEVDQSPWER